MRKKKVSTLPSKNRLEYNQLNIYRTYEPLAEVTLPRESPSKSKWQCRSTHWTAHREGRNRTPGQKQSQ